MNASESANDTQPAAVLPSLPPQLELNISDGRTDNGQYTGEPGGINDDVIFSEGPPWWLVVHIYGFACLFFMLAFYAFFSGMNIRQDYLIL
ncbi:hypothetical protein FJT64_021462 [Amphibalanus amphitrite]|uniref:Uncharacterized protein n=1 Tax=Amphibalanus amphitrite TaxID=1232801 RepID=A0A6A4WXK2_AMPAM|nr:hypothetical protein FJT64_021462 [Amphibalanus amphitrite]